MTRHALAMTAPLFFFLLFPLFLFACSDDDSKAADAAASIDGTAADATGNVIDAMQAVDADSCPACTDAIGCKLVDGKRMFTVTMATQDESGNSVCMSLGMTCVDAPVYTPPQAACLAFHPGADVTSDGNGWRQSVYCAGDLTDLACAGKNANSCHDCPACLIDSLKCGTANSANLTELFVECVCP